VAVVSAQMELTNDFEVDLPVDEAWVVLTDVERIAPCLPGAELREVEGDEYRGVVKVKVGPITAEYKGKASFVELDGASHHAVLRAQGRDTRGQGNASATISATLEPRDSSTHVSVVTELTISGRVAQFGRGVLAEVSNKLMSEFVERLHASLSSSVEVVDGAESDDALRSESALPDGIVRQDEILLVGAVQDLAGNGRGQSRADRSIPQETGGDGAVSEQSVRVVARPEAAAVDLVGVAGWPVLKKLLPAAIAAILVGLVATRLWGKRASRPHGQL